MYQIDSVPEVVNCSCKSDLETRFRTMPWSDIGQWRYDFPKKVCPINVCDQWWRYCM